MSADIEKLAVFDDRIVQSRPRYAVEKGALSVTNSPFSAIGLSASQQTYNINVPSENVFIDRAVEWSSTCALQFQVTIANDPALVGQPVVVFGRDCALSAFPLHSLTQTLTATINDTTTTMNTGDVLYEVLRLTDYKKNRAQRTCPTYLDTYKSYDRAFGAVNNPLGDFSTACDSGSVPNGAYYNVYFTDATGQALTGNGVYNDGTNNINYTQGVPVVTGAPITSYRIFVRFRSTEKIVLSPFVFSDTHESDTGLFGIQNIQLVMNMNSPSQTATSGRVLRSTTRAGRTISQVAYNATVSGGSPFTDSRVNVQFLTPSLDIPLPPKSVVPYMEFPRFIYNQSFSTPIAIGGTATGVQSQTITLPQIPDLMIIYAKPNQQGYTVAGPTTFGPYAPTDADFYLPITQISINFDNFSGLLSSHTAEQLYGMSFRNGLDMDWEQWSGQAKLSALATTAGDLPNGTAATVGGFLVLKPSQDIVLQSGQAPSLVGNFTFQFNCNLLNTTGGTLNGCSLYVITANSGFFESIKGSSRVIKGVLTEADIISAPLAPMGTRSALTRVVGGQSVLSRLGNVIGKVREFAPLLKPLAQAAKPMLPSGVQDVMSAVGLGKTGGQKKAKLHMRLAE